MEQTDKIHTDKCNQHSNDQNDINTDLYFDYFTIFGFLLSRFAYELLNEKRMSD